MVVFVGFVCCGVTWGSEEWRVGVRVCGESVGNLEDVFFVEVVEGEKLINLKNAGAEAGGGDFGGEVAAFEADETGGDGVDGGGGESGVGGYGGGGVGGG